MNQVEVLRIERITKVYPNGFVANKDVSFCVNEGEIHALAGENGAGKSTLMKVLFGAEKADRGEIYRRGEKVQCSSPSEAIRHGVGMVHQHFMLVPSLTVAENLVLGNEKKKRGLFDYSDAVKAVHETSKKYGLPMDPHARVRDLPVGLKQRLEILKALYRGAKLLILDEPTAVLAPQETVEIFAELKKLKEMGHTIIFITHKLNEIKALCDNITIMRDGAAVGTYAVDSVSENDISRYMVGRDVKEAVRPARETVAPPETRLSVQELCYSDAFGKRVLNGLTFDVDSGEILGVAGIEGNGQNELSEIINGLKKADSGRVLLNGEDLAPMSIRERREKGLSFILQDRMLYGVAARASIAENMISERYDKKPYSKGILLNREYINDTSERLIQQFEIKCDGPDQPAGMLSGGNMQKVVAAREVSAAPSVIVANQPTRGIDVGAAQLVRQKLIDLREDGSSVLLISADLAELMQLSDRLIVLRNGAVVAEYDDPAQAGMIRIGESMLGLDEGASDDVASN